MILIPNKTIWDNVLRLDNPVVKVVKHMSNFWKKAPMTMIN
jgi:hypothetical protein